jgi:hypothetical protein
VLDLLGRSGGLGNVEVELRCAVVAALRATGETDRARAELREAIHQVRLRADDVPAGAPRARYLTRNPHCARVRALAQAWLDAEPFAGEATQDPT